jgi:hypothetical protein
LLAIKSNQGKLYDELNAVFEDHRVHEMASEGEASHGRGEQRYAWVCRDIESLPIASSWPGCHVVLQTEHEFSL